MIKKNYLYRTNQFKTNGHDCRIIVAQLVYYYVFERPWDFYQVYIYIYMLENKMFHNIVMFRVIWELL